jgi:hypothetical protein
MAITFSGGQYFYVTNDTLFNNLTTAITYMTWVKLTRLPTAGDGGAFSLFGRSVHTNGDYSWEAGVLTNGNPVSELSTNSGLVDNTSSFVMAINTWYHYATTWDSTSQNCLIYINGALQTTSSTPGTTLLTATNSSQMCVGANVGSGAVNPFQELVGSLEDIRVYNRTLSAGEISTIYATGGRDDIVNGLFLRFPFNENSVGATVVAANLVDYSSNKISFTNLVGSPVFDAGLTSSSNAPFGVS